MTNHETNNQPELEWVQTDGTLSTYRDPVTREMSQAVSDYAPQESGYPRHFAVRIERAKDKSLVQQLVALKKLYPPLAEFANTELLDQFKNEDEWTFGGLLPEEAEALVKKAEEKGFSVSLLNFDDSHVPYAWRGVYRMLGKAYPLGIPESEYMLLICVLYEYMSDRNLAEVLSLFTGKKADMVLNDIYESAATYRSSDEAFDSVKEKLVAQGLHVWAEEADLSHYEEMWTLNKDRYALYEMEANRYVIVTVDPPAMVLIEEDHIAEQVIQRMLDHGSTILDKRWIANK